VRPGMRSAFGVRRLACIAGWVSLRRRIRSNFGFVITRTETGSHKLSSLRHHCQYRRTPNAKRRTPNAERQTPNAKRISLTRPSIRAPLSC